MLESLVHRGVLSLSFAGLLTSSAFAQAPCAAISGGVPVGATIYCVDKAGVLYYQNGSPLQKPELLQQLQESEEYKNAVQRAQASSLPTTALSPSPSPPPVQQPRPRGPPPPYLQPGYVEPSSGGQYLSPSLPRSPASEPSTSSNNKKNDPWGYLLLGLGLVGMGTSVILISSESPCEQAGTCFNPHKEEDKSELIGGIVGGAVLAGLGIYFLSD